MTTWAVIVATLLGRCHVEFYFPFILFSFHILILVYFFLPAILAGDVTTLWGVLGLFVFGEIMLLVLAWFTKKRSSKTKSKKDKD
jgi:hypothetical protein